MDPLLEGKIYARQVERREWLQLDEEWYSLFCRVSQKLRDFHSSMTLDSSSQSAAKRARRDADFELPWLPERVREVYSERDVYARLYLLELLREGCGRILTASRRGLRE
jgi:hypothetical protein